MEGFQLYTLIATVFTFGGLVRFVDGSDGYVFGVKIPNCLRVASMFSIAVFAVWPMPIDLVQLKQTYINPIIVLLVALSTPLFITLSLIVGHTDWTDWKWQPLRFGLFGAASIVMLNDFQAYWPIPVVMAFGGLTSPIWFAIDKYVFELPTHAKLDGPEAYSRFTVGGFILSSPLWVLI